MDRDESLPGLHSPGISSFGLFAAGSMLLWVAGEFVLRRIGVASLAGPLGSARGADMLLVCIGFPFLGFGIATWGRRVGITSSDWEYRLSVRTVAAGIGGFVLYFVCFVGFTIVYTTLAGVPSSTTPAVVDSDAEVWVLAILFVVNGIVVPIAEELAWRGAIQTALTEAYSPLIGVVVTATGFVLKHVIVDGGEPLSRLVSLVVLALVLCGLRSRFGTASSTVTHLGVNLVATGFAVLTVL